MKRKPKPKQLTAFPEDRIFLRHQGHERQFQSESHLYTYTERCQLKVMDVDYFNNSTGGVDRVFHTTPPGKYEELKRTLCR